MNSRLQRRSGRTGGFSLIELMVAMSILAIIVALLGGLFSDVSTAWTKADKRNEVDNAARSAMDWLIREISNGLVTSNLHAVLISDYVETYAGLQSDALYFVCLNEEPRGGDYRAARQLGFYCAPSVITNDGDEITVYNLEFNERSRITTMDCYLDYDSDNKNIKPNRWWLDHQEDAEKYPGEVIAENVTAFDVWMYIDPNEDGQLEEVNDFNSRDTASLNTPAKKFPVMADIYIELLGRADAVRAHYLQQVSDQACLDFISKNAKGYVTRVYFDNRDGYLKSLP